jgi:hypothetical protein
MAFELGGLADYLSQSGGAADVAGGAAGLGELIPGLGALLALGFTIEDLVSGNFASLIDPFGIFGLGGVPKGAKTAGAAQTLEGEGGVAGELGRGIASLEGGKGSNVLSNPAFAHETNTLADALTWLSGKALPGWKAMGSTGEIAGIKPPSGAPYSKDVNIMGVQSPAQLIAQLGKSPNLTPEQIQKILPQLEALAKQPGMTVAGLKGPLETDVNSYLNQGQGQRDQPNPTSLPFPFPIPGFPFGFGDNSSNTNENTNNTVNNLFQSMFGAALKQPQPTAARFAPFVPSPLPVA